MWNMGWKAAKFLEASVPMLIWYSQIAWCVSANVNLIQLLNIFWFWWYQLEQCRMLVLDIHVVYNIFGVLPIVSAHMTLLLSFSILIWRGTWKVTSRAMIEIGIQWPGRKWQARATLQELLLCPLLNSMVISPRGTPQWRHLKMNPQWLPYMCDPRMIQEPWFTEWKTRSSDVMNASISADNLTRWCCTFVLIPQ